MYWNTHSLLTSNLVETEEEINVEVLRFQGQFLMRAKEEEKDWEMGVPADKVLAVQA